MYGTIARLAPKPGHQDAIRQLLVAWDQARRPHVRGVRDSYVFVPDARPDDIYLVVLFDDEPGYRANADDPEQDAWYRQLREHLSSDPEWMDGHFEAA